MVEMSAGSLTSLHLSPADTSLARPQAPFLFPQTVNLNTPEAMRPFRERPLVVLAPHFGDASLSLGCFLAAAGHGTLITIFSQGTRLGRETWDQMALYDLRDAENNAFCDRCGLDSRDIGCEEPELRGRRSRDMHHVADDLAQIEKPVLRTVNKISASFGPRRRGFLLAPLGVAAHANHRATAELVRRHLARLGDHYDVLFYEERPSSPLQRLAALRRVSGRIAGGLGPRHVLTSSWPEKRMLLPVHSAERGWPRGVLREAFWAVGRNGLRPPGG